MALDKLVDSTQLDADLTSVANAIRTKGGTSAQLAFPAGFVSAVEAIPTGGGGGKGFLLLDTITVPANTRAVNLDFSNYQSYDFFFVVEDVNLSAADWLYIVRNGSSPSGGTYANSAQHHYGVCFMQINTIPTKSGISASGIPQASGVNVIYSFNNDACTNLYIYTYSANKTILAGSKFYICGGNYADL